MSEPITILVVDADQAFRESVANLLLACGVEKFAMASTTEEAKEKISETLFDIVLIDLFMPHMNGFVLAQQLQEQLPNTKIILLIEDHQLYMVNSIRQKKIDFPTILKSFVNRMLPQLLTDSKSARDNDNLKDQR